MNWCILIPVIVGIISAILGYLLGKILGKGNINENVHNAMSTLEADLTSCRRKNKHIEAELESYKSRNNTSSHNPSLEKTTSTTDYAQLKADLSTSTSKIKTLEAEVDTYKSKYEALRNTNIDTTKDVDKYREQITKLETDLRSITSKSSILENDLETCKMEKSRLKATINDIENNSASRTNALASGLSANTEASLPFNADVAKTIFGKKIKQDDLKLVEGIGPKIEQLFHNHNITTWKALSECSIEQCRNVLKSGGKRFELHKPDTWPKQAKLAYEGKWQELLDWQDELDGGKL